MKIQQINSYQKHGCNIFPQGKQLVLIEYCEEYLDGEFGSGSIYRGLSAAEKLLQENYPNAEIALSIPDLVARV